MMTRKRRRQCAPCTDQISPFPIDTCIGILAVAVADMTTVDGGADGVLVSWGCSDALEAVAGVLDANRRAREPGGGTRLSQLAVAGGGGLAGI